MTDSTRSIGNVSDGSSHHTQVFYSTATSVRALLSGCILAVLISVTAASTQKATSERVYAPTRVVLKDRMELAGRNLVRMLNPEHDYLPNFLIAVEPDYTAESSSRR